MDRHRPASCTLKHTHYKYMTPFKTLWRELLIDALSLNIVGIISKSLLIQIPNFSKHIPILSPNVLYMLKTIIFLIPFCRHKCFSNHLFIFSLQYLSRSSLSFVIPWHMRSHATKPRPSLLQKASPFQSAVATFYPCLSNTKSKNIQYCVNKETTNRLYGECDRCVKCFWNILTLSQNWRADSLGSLSHTAFLRKKIYKVIHQKNNEDCMQASSWHFSWSEVRQPSVFCTCMY